MRTHRPDSLWSHLSPTQRDTLESWLFDDLLSYADAAARVRQEFGLEVSVSAISRLARRRTAQREIDDLAEAQLDALKCKDSAVNLPDFRDAMLKLAAKAALRLITENPDDPDRALPLVRLLLDAERNDLRRSRLQLAQARFEYGVTVASLEDLPRVRAALKTIEDEPSLSEDQKLERVDDLLFGWRTHTTGVGAGAPPTPGALPLTPTGPLPTPPPQSVGPASCLPFTPSSLPGTPEPATRPGIPHPAQLATVSTASSPCATRRAEGAAEGHPMITQTAKAAATPSSVPSSAPSARAEAAFFPPPASPRRPRTANHQPLSKTPEKPHEVT